VHRFFVERYSTTGLKVYSPVHVSFIEIPVKIACDYVENQYEYNQHYNIHKRSKVFTLRSRVNETGSICEDENKRVIEISPGIRFPEECSSQWQKIKT
jgi:hypothetical protein